MATATRTDRALSRMTLQELARAADRWRAALRIAERAVIGNAVDIAPWAEADSDLRARVFTVAARLYYGEGAEQ